jgi:hypothetical protein
MSVGSLSRTELEPGAVCALKALRALDLTPRPGARALWMSTTRGHGTTTAPAAADLPQPGFASPMGFWLTEVPEIVAESTVSPYLIRFESPSTAAAQAAMETSPAAAVKPRRPDQTVRLKPPHAGDGELVLKLSTAGVRIITTDAAWKALSEPVLLAIGIYWRFLAIEEELDRLTEQAHADVDHATMPGGPTWKDRRGLIARARAVRAFILDLPHFQGPITDPFPYCSTERSAQTFAGLAEKLHLEMWCELIDERVEVIEDAYEVATEKLMEFRHFVYEAGLEVLIVLILLGELGLLAWEQFGP